MILACTACDSRYDVTGYAVATHGFDHRSRGGALVELLSSLFS